MTFDEDLQKGKEYEIEVIQMLKLLYEGKKFKQITKEENPDFYRHLDIIEVPKGKKKIDSSKLLKFECKYSGDKHKDSPNVVVEYESFRYSPSGICTTNADYWVFKTGNFHTIVKTEELLRAILYDLGKQHNNRRLIRTKVMDHKRLLFIPISLLMDKRLCPSTIRQLTKQAIQGIINET